MFYEHLNVFVLVFIKLYWPSGKAESVIDSFIDWLIHSFEKWQPRSEHRCKFKMGM